jgi:hypothetical protein
MGGTRTRSSNTAGVRPSQRTKWTNRPGLPYSLFAVFAASRGSLCLHQNFIGHWPGREIIAVDISFTHNRHVESRNQISTRSASASRIFTVNGGHLSLQPRQLERRCNAECSRRYARAASRIVFDLGRRCATAPAAITTSTEITPAKRPRPRSRSAVETGRDPLVRR